MTPDEVEHHAEVERQHHLAVQDEREQQQRIAQLEATITDLQRRSRAQMVTNLGLAAQIARVRKLHKLETHTTADGNKIVYCSYCCDGLIHEGPCETLTALDPEPTTLNSASGDPS